MRYTVQCSPRADEVTLEFEGADPIVITADQAMELASQLMESALVAHPDPEVAIATLVQDGESVLDLILGDGPARDSEPPL